MLDAVAATTAWDAADQTTPAGQHRSGQPDLEPTDAVVGEDDALTDVDRARIASIIASADGGESRPQQLPQSYVSDTGIFTAAEYSDESDGADDVADDAGAGLGSYSDDTTSEAGQSEEGDGVCKSGFLWSQGQQMRKWNQRWFQLTGTHLVYYANTVAGSRPRAAIPLCGCDAVLTSERGRPHCLSLVLNPEHRHQHARYMLDAESEVEQQSWKYEIDKISRRLAAQGWILSAAAATTTMSTSVAASETLKAGWVLSRGRMKKLWKRRWLVLQADSLEYYKSPADTEARATIALDGIGVVMHSERSKPFCLRCPRPPGAVKRP
jgi:hypothetical protein